MKTLKTAALVLSIALLGLTSCQKSDVNPNGAGPKISGADTTKTPPVPTSLPGMPVISGDTVIKANTTVVLTATCANATSYIWFSDLTPIVGQTGKTLTISAAGSYRVQGVNQLGDGDRTYSYIVTASN